MTYTKCHQNRCGKNARSATAGERCVLPAGARARFRRDGKSATTATGLEACYAPIAAEAAAGAKARGLKISYYFGCALWLSCQGCMPVPQGSLRYRAPRRSAVCILSVRSFLSGTRAGRRSWRHSRWRRRLTIFQRRGFWFGYAGHIIRVYVIPSQRIKISWGICPITSARLLVICI
jgi:hypothetical protein